MTKPHLAIVSPLPPSWSGIASYTAGLLPHLAKHWNVTVVVGPGEDVDTEAFGPVRVVHAPSFQWFHEAGGIDRLLHCLGNSEYHRHVPTLVERHGGVVLAHDVRLNALQCLRAVDQFDPHWLSTVVERRHGFVLSRDIRLLEDAGGVSAQFQAIRRRLDEANTFLLSGCVGLADSVAVHSTFARDLADLELQGHVPVHVVPFGHPEQSDGPIDLSSNVISTFGFVAPEKNAGLLVEAVGLLLERGRPVELRYVGHCPEGYEKHLRDLSARHRVAHHVTFAGRQDESIYRAEFRSAAVAVQLRAAVNGEASAAIADCLSSGLPTIVSALGAQGELPDDVVAKVPGRVTASALADQIDDLMADPRRRASLSAAAMSYAGRHSFAVAADALSDVLESAKPMR